MGPRSYCSFWFDNSKRLFDLISSERASNGRASAAHLVCHIACKACTQWMMSEAVCQSEYFMPFIRHNVRTSWHVMCRQRSTSHSSQGREKKIEGERDRELEQNWASNMLVCVCAMYAYLYVSRECEQRNLYTIQIGCRIFVEMISTAVVVVGIRFARFSYFGYVLLRPTDILVFSVSTIASMRTCARICLTFAAFVCYI